MLGLQMLRVNRKMWAFRTALWCGLAVVYALPLAAQVKLTGRITNETNVPVAGASITLETLPPGGTYETISEPTGEFELVVPQGSYNLRVDREGFYVHRQEALALPLLTAEGAPGELHVALQTIYELRTAIDVKEQTGVIDMDRTTPQTTLSSRTLYDVPFPDQNSLRSGLRMIPGVVQDSAGDVHLFGGAETQAEYTFEGFQLNDPLTGRLEARMSLESVQSVDVAASQSGAENGRGASGVMAMHARSGGDEFKYSATNIFPGIDIGSGLRVGSWTPRGNISGPWKKRKAWFFNTTELQYTDTLVPGLPHGENTTSAWRFSDILHNQINLGLRNVLRVGLLYNYFAAEHSGLTTLDPLSTTVSRRSSQWFGYVRDQQSFTRSSLLEIGFAASRTGSRQAPEGNSPYQITPTGQTGNYFANTARNAERYQALANYFLPSFRLLGAHQIKTGVDSLHLVYDQSIQRSAIQYIGIDGTVVRSISFTGSGDVSRTNNDRSFYVQDSWRPLSTLIIDVGWRFDHDLALRRSNMSPRVGVGWSPTGARSIRFSGGFGRIFDPTDLGIFVRPLDQTRVETFFNPAGATIYGPITTSFAFGSHVHNPRADVWNLGVERSFPKQILARLQLLRRRSNGGFDYYSDLPVNEQLPAILAGAPNPGPLNAVYTLVNRREDRYDSAEISIRQPLRGRYEWMFSYTRSRALSNAVVSRAIDEPLGVINNSGPLPWDAPNRIVNWGYLPTLWKDWSIAYLLDWHTGYPFSVRDQYGQLVGAADDHRFTQFFELNFFVERQFTFFDHVIAIRGGFNNITGHQNPNVVDGVVGSPMFLKETGGQARALNFRLRFLGKP